VVGIYRINGMIGVEANPPLGVVDIEEPISLLL
jgi:hypothetical protein